MTRGLRMLLALLVLAWAVLSIGTTSGFASSRIVYVRALAPAIAPAVPAARARGIFFSRWILIRPPSFASGAVHFLLAGSADGRADIRTDDRLVLTLAPRFGASRQMIVQFGRPDGGGVLSSRPLDITSFLGIPPFHLRIALIDTVPPVYSSSAYFLVGVGASIAGHRTAGVPGSARRTSPLPGTPRPPLPAPATQHHSVVPLWRRLMVPVIVSLFFLWLCRRLWRAAIAHLASAIARVEVRSRRL